MRFNVVLGLLWAGVALASRQWDSQAWVYSWMQQAPAAELITRDVAIIGGGSSGTYAAIKLRDMNYTVAVVEKSGRMGGHTEAFTDPATGTPINIGLVVWHDADLVHKYFDRLNVPLTKVKLSRGTTHYYDFATGRPNTNYTLSDPAAALKVYAEHLQKYPYVETGFDLPDEVPEDLLLPFGEFAAKYGIGPVAELAFQYCQGLGAFVHLETLYVMKNFGLGVVQNIQNGFVAAASGNNSDIYGKAQAELGEDVLLHSTVLSVQRDADSEGYVSVMVQTPDCIKIIRAKQLLLTIPPELSNVEPFALDDRETAIFAKFRHTYYYTGLLVNAGLPSDLTLQNTGNGTPFSIPQLPAVYNFYPSGVEGLMSVKFGAPSGTITAQSSTEGVQAAILATLQRLRNAGSVDFTAGDNATPSFAILSKHSPFEMTVPAEEIRNGFYKQLNALQGHRNVWWTGAAFHTQDSTLLWEFTEGVVDKLVEKLK